MSRGFFGGCGDNDCWLWILIILAIIVICCCCNDDCDKC